MKSMILAAAVFASGSALAQDIVVSPTRSIAGYELLAADRNADAIALLRGETSEPSRLINLGTAYARLGQRDQAAHAYRLAMFSDDRSDIELASGRMMDSRAAARAALARLDANRTLIAVR